MSTLLNFFVQVTEILGRDNFFEGPLCGPWWIADPDPVNMDPANFFFVFLVTLYPR